MTATTMQSRAKHTSPTSRGHTRAAGPVVGHADPVGRGGHAGPLVFPATYATLTPPALPAAGAAVARLAGVVGPKGEDLADVVGVRPDGLLLANGRVLPAAKVPGLVRGLLAKNAGKDRRRNAEVLIQLMAGAIRAAGTPG